MNKKHLTPKQIQLIFGGSYCGCSTIDFNHATNKSKVFKVDNVYTCIYVCCNELRHHYYHFSTYLYTEKFTGYCGAPMLNIKKAYTVAEKIIRDSDFNLNGVNTPGNSKK